MLIGMKSIYWRIMGSFILIIFLTVLLSTTIEYLSNQAELPKLLTEIRTENIAEILSSSYTREQGWGTLKGEINRLNADGQLGSSEKITLRFIVRDKDGKTLFNSFSDLVQRDNSPLIEGGSVEIVDYDTLKVVGTITLYLNKEYLEKETADYIITILKPRIFQGVLTFIIAFFVAAFLSRRITTPITALTRAARGISESGESQKLPVYTTDELGQMSESFNQMIESLQNQRELRKRLISDVSHEINTPLNVIRLEAKGLLDSLVSPDEAATQIITEVDTLSNLIHDLDWLAETDSGQFKLNLIDCSVAQLIESEVQRWEFKAKVAEITLALIPLAPSLPTFKMDVVRLSQVLGNLIENGLKYTPAGGNISIECYQEDSSVVITIQDDGIGIPSEHLPHLFERFYRVDSSRTTSGRGLGLAIVKQIVVLHQGNIRAESEVGVGSTFIIKLPIRSTL